MMDDILEPALKVGYLRYRGELGLARACANGSKHGSNLNENSPPSRVKSQRKSILMRIRAPPSPSTPTAWGLGIALKAQTKVQLRKAAEISASQQ